MKKVLLLACLLIMALTLVACDDGYQTGDYVGDGDFIVVGNLGEQDVLKDVETGCEYLQPNDSYALSPYLNEKGEVIGCGEPVNELEEAIQ